MQILLQPMTDTAAVLDDVQAFLAEVLACECEYSGWSEGAIERLWKSVAKASEELSMSEPAMAIGEQPVEMVLVSKGQSLLVGVNGLHVRLTVDADGTRHIEYDEHEGTERRTLHREHDDQAGYCAEPECMSQATDGDVCELHAVEVADGQ